MTTTTIKVGGAMMLLGVVLTVFSVRSYLRNSRLADVGVEGMAEVVRTISTDGSEKSLFIELPDPNKTRTVVALSRTTKNHAGDKIKVVYDPEDPTEVSLGGKEKIRQDGGFPVLSVLFGLASTAAGFLWIARSGDRRA